MSLRVDLDKQNMDLVMELVRSWDCKPTDVINTLLSDINLNEARSKWYGKEGKKGYEKTTRK